MFLVGKIIGTHGIKGEVKVKSDTSFNRYEPESLLYIKQGQDFIECKINSHRKHKNLDLITFNNYQNINEVLEYVGLEIYTKHDQTELQENEFYYEDLIGLKAISTNGEDLGKVVDVREVPQGAILEIQTQTNKFLVPFVDEFIKDINKDIIVIELIEGLV